MKLLTLTTFLVLFFFSMERLCAQKYVTVFDSTTAKTYRIKIDGTRLRVKGVHSKEIIKCYLESFDSTGMVFDIAYGKYKDIESITFRPYWKSVSYMNGFYFVGMANLFLYVGFDGIGGGYGAGYGIAIMVVTSPIWAIGIPTVLNLTMSAFKPQIEIRNPVFAQFSRYEGK